MNQVKKMLILRYFMILAVIVGSFCILSAVGIFAYMLVSPGVAIADTPPTVDIWTGQELEPPEIIENTSSNNESSSNNKLEDLFKAPVRTNFVLIGVDNNNLSDVIMAGSFNTETKTISLISIPRDTYVKLPQDRIQELRNLGRKNIPSNGIMKINAVHSYAGKEFGAEYVLRQVEDILCVQMDFYVEVSLSAFKKIVDDIGGVQMNIPGNGLYYSDPEQNLLINIPGGLVMLNGDKAEGLVRYRNTYARGDLQRVEVQQEFMKELFRQALARDRILSNAPALISTFVSYVTTNFKITDLPKYLWYLDEITSYDFVAYTLPGTDGNSIYYNHDVEETAKLVERIFY